MTINKIKNIALLSLTLIVVFLFALNGCQRKEMEAAQRLLEYKNDTVQVYQDKYERTVAEKQTLYVASQKEIQRLAKTNSDLQRLNEAIKKEKNKVLAATVVKTNVGGEITGKVDTILVDSASPCRPTYKIDVKEKWYELNGFVNSETFSLTPRFLGEIEVLQTEDKHLFKPHEFTTKVKFDNPYYTATDVQTFSQECKCDRIYWFGAGFVGGTAATIGLRMYLRSLSTP